MLTAIIAAAFSVVTAIVVAIITYVLTRRREREADWRKLKFGQYQEYLLALSGIVEGRSTPEAQARYSDAFNSMLLVASAPVLRALQDFQNENRCSNPNRSPEKHDRLLNVLLRAMRADMLPNGARDLEELQVYLITVPPCQEAGDRAL